MTIREKVDQNTYAERPTSSGASSACSWFISNDTHNARIGTDTGDIEFPVEEDTVHIVGGHSSQLICSNRTCSNQLNPGTNVERGNKILLTISHFSEL